MKIKRLSPYQPKSCPRVSDKTSLAFRFSWYEKAEWRCYWDIFDALFCFYCLLFSTVESSPWIKAGVRNLKHLSQKIETHSICDMHLHSPVKYKVFGSTMNIISQLNDAHSQSMVRCNENIARNRHVLKLELSVRSKLAPFTCRLWEWDVFTPSCLLDILDYTTNVDEKLCDQLSNATLARNSSKDIQNDFLDSIYEVYLARVESEISSCEFV